MQVHIFFTPGTSSLADEIESFTKGAISIKYKFHRNHRDYYDAESLGVVQTGDVYHEDENDKKAVFNSDVQYVLMLDIFSWMKGKRDNMRPNDLYILLLDHYNSDEDGYTWFSTFQEKWNGTPLVNTFVSLNTLKKATDNLYDDALLLAFEMISQIIRFRIFPDFKTYYKGGIKNAKGDLNDMADTLEDYRYKIISADFIHDETRETVKKAVHADPTNLKILSELMASLQNIRVKLLNYYHIFAPFYKCISIDSINGEIKIHDKKHTSITGLGGLRDESYALFIFYLIKQKIINNNYFAEDNSKLILRLICAFRYFKREDLIEDISIGIINSLPDFDGVERKRYLFNSTIKDVGKYIPEPFLQPFEFVEHDRGRRILFDQKKHSRTHSIRFETLTTNFDDYIQALKKFKKAEFPRIDIYFNEIGL